MGIPKKLYYVWIGDKEKPEIFYKCYESWKKKMPDYEIVEINEKNFDVSYYYENNKFFKKCWDKKLWAFVADYIRVIYLYENGGYFLDTDMEIVKDFTKLNELQNDKIEFFASFESEDGIGLGLFGTKSKSKILKDIIKFYEKEIWEVPIFVLPHILRYIMKKKYNHDLTQKEIFDEKIGMYILKKEYFYPFLPNEKWDRSLLENYNYAIHWWDHSWKGKKHFLFLKTKHLKGWKKLLKKIGIYLQIIRDFIRNKIKK